MRWFWCEKRLKCACTYANAQHAHAVGGDSTECRDMSLLALSVVRSSSFYGRVVGGESGGWGEWCAGRVVGGEIGGWGEWWGEKESAESGANVLVCFTNDIECVLLL